ncbi:DUF1236 domain-containing protein [Aureimonas mangrovi]|uniref:DUF1236 domain-containing protein n=1 Tax=Aureimonas mangrovi TaxID=2758041 RepID=UPI00163D8030|nr:DUF1236 domain-containing protein [Aureimonas mangrovi]
MRTALLAASTAAIALAAPTFAQTTTTTTTTVVEETTAAPVVEIPGTVRTYVVEQAQPSVTLEGRLVRGEILPDTVEYYDIPEEPDYAYTVVNNQRVLVRPSTREIIEIYE